MLKYLSHTCDRLEDGEYQMNKQIEKYIQQGYHLLNAGINNRQSSGGYAFTVWAVMMHSQKG